ncbi:MAG TPA: alpha/beta hydrolase [Segeticoccus sp.]|nr:alpha/beta hydrolase [Segeticoccus sp.]
MTEHIWSGPTLAAGAPVSHRFVQLPDLRVHVAESGSGTPVLALHGFPQHWWQWRRVLPGLADRHRVLCPDLRGSGWTDAPAHGYGRDQLLADVLALLDVLELDQVHLLTHDWGSLVGYQLCLRHPERVRSHLALSIPPPFFAPDPRLAPVMVTRTWFNLVLPVPGLGARSLRAGRQRLLRRVLQGFSARDAFSEDDIEHFLAPFREPARARAGSLLYRHFIQPEGVRILTGRYAGQRLTTPTTVLVGAEDPLGPDVVHGYERHCDDLRVELVEGASHFLVDDRPDVVLQRALERFGAR